MKFTRTFTTVLTYDSADVQSLAIKNLLNASIKTELENRYTLKCYEGCFIIQIISYTRSDGFINSQGQESTMNFNIKFVARCEVVEVGEIIPHCRIVTKAGHLALENPYMIAIVKMKDHLNSFKVGQLLPIQVKTSVHTPGKRITINATEYIYDKRDQKYFIVEHQPTKIAFIADEGAPFIELLKAMIAEIDELYGKINGYEKDRVTYFSELFFNKGVKKEGINFFEEAKKYVTTSGDIKKMSLRPGMLVNYPGSMDKMYPVVVEEKGSSNHGIPRIDLNALLPLLLSQHYSFIRLVQYFAMSYDIQSFEKDYENLILFYKREPKRGASAAAAAIADPIAPLPSTTIPPPTAAKLEEKITLILPGQDIKIDL